MAIRIAITLQAMLSKVLKKQFEDKDFTCLLVFDSASAGGSRAERDRCYPVIYDIPRDIADSLELEDNFYRLLKAMHLEPYDWKLFELSDDVNISDP